MAFRQLRCTGSVFACAPQPLVKQRMDELAAAKALQPRPPGKCHDCKSVLASGDRVRLDAHLAQMDGFQDVSVDITQNVGHTAALSVLPTIIKNSKLFCVRAGRIFLPVPLRLPEHFSAAVAETATRDLKDMVGNGMALCEVGAVLALVLVSACHQ